MNNEIIVVKQLPVIQEQLQQIKADVTGIRLSTLKEKESACLGTAIIAMVGAGESASFKEATDTTVCVDKTYTPDGDDYTDAYKKYCELDNKLNIKE